MSLNLDHLPGPWRFEAACNPGTAESFFPGKGVHSPVTKKTCATCPVVKECRAYALANREPFGIWGGMSEAERRAELAQQKENVA